ncbi:MAG: hypothetical protein OXM03_02295 [Chloroflexota bacterium]|nr:hypothetical protein [Chloroflexota bacterium]MDE2839439.1 hypothetical protein [Chloroflexota bacterium]MDE2930478.1 hypothetical protein [Chloroflexota bacterium]
MNALKKVLALILSLIAIAVLFQLLFSPFYPDTVDINWTWNVLNWFIAFGVAVALIATYLNKRGLSAGSSTGREYIFANTAFYAAAVLAIWFFWNWFDDLTVGEEGQSELRLIFWSYINPLFIILMGTVSARLWRDASRT